MDVMTIEGIVEHGRIQLPAHIHLPDKTRVYVVVPDIQFERRAHIPTPHLLHPEQAADFVLQVVENADDASV